MITDFVFVTMAFPDGVSLRAQPLATISLPFGQKPQNPFCTGKFQIDRYPFSIRLHLQSTSFKIQLHEKDEIQ
jgi:hypothetical protein